MMGVDLLKIMIFNCCLRISEKKLINTLEKMKKCMFVLTFESLIAMITFDISFSNKNLLHCRKTDLKQQNKVIRLRKTFKDFRQKI